MSDLVRVVGARLALPAGAIEVAVQAWKLLPQGTRDRIVAELLREAKQVAVPLLRAAVAYAVRRVTEGAPVEDFPNLSPAMEMTEAGMAVPGPGDMWTRFGSGV